MYSLYKKHEEIINYLIVGGVTTLISLAVKYALLFTVLHASNPFELQVSVVVSWIAAVTFAYFANKIIVFKSKNKDVFKEVLEFLGSRVLTLLLDAFIMWFFVTLLKMDTRFYVILWTFVSQVIIIILNYILGKMIFKKDVKH